MIPSVCMPSVNMDGWHLVGTMLDRHDITDVSIPTKSMNIKRTPKYLESF